MTRSLDAVSVKAQLRLTALKLGQLQERKDSQASITKRDIATLLHQGNIGLARAKAQNLLQEDATGDLMEVLEMHVGILLEHFSEIEQRAQPSPTVVEAASSIIFAAPHTESKDLNIVRDFLVQYFGPDFARSAIGNRDNYVSSRVVRSLSAPPVSAAKFNDYLSGIAATYGVKWAPELRPQDVLNALSEILDPTSSPIVDLPRLRKLCLNGIPDDPPWLRPRIWKLFFGILPLLKSSWGSEMIKQRESYYDLIRRLLAPFSAPTTPAASLASDALLMDAFNQLSSVPHFLFGGLGDEPDHSVLGPLDDVAPHDIKIECAANLDNRVRDIRNQGSTNNVTPEIRLESDSIGTPEISLSEPGSLAARRPGAPTTLLHSQSLNSLGAHKKHASALLRLLYIHNCLNPANHSPHVPSLLVPLYSVLIQEVEPLDLAHAEADTFWLFEAVVGEFAEMEDEEGGNLWMRRFGERLVWADNDLAENLHAKGLDPSLPHYSYRWLAPLLTQTLPLSSVFMVWDALFSCPMRERDSSAKLDYLLDICTSMLIRARTPLFRLGKPGRRSPGLWIEENASLPPPSPLRAWELGDAFLEGMSLLRLYPIEAAGGIDRVLQTASDLAHRREEESKTQKAENLSLGARLKVTMWKGFTNQVSSPDSPESSSEEEDSDNGDAHDDGNETETPLTVGSPGLTSRLATTVWRGLTNQSSMDDVPTSPVSPASSRPISPSTSSPLPSPSGVTQALQDGSPQLSPTSQPSTSIWGYAEKLKDSDTAATLAKVSSNWRAKAMDVWSTRGNTGRASPNAVSSSSVSSTGNSVSVVRTGSFGPLNHSKVDDTRRGSLPGLDRSSVYSPPTRPAFFRPPRDSMLPQPRKGPTTSSPVSPQISPQFDGSILHKTRASLASITGIQSPMPAPAPKPGPRPLLLGSSSVMHTSKPPPIMRSATNTPTPHQGQWSDVLRNKGRMVHRDSQSSISSLSPSDALGKPWGRSQSDWESDTNNSRVVPLNRRSVSPMAPNFRLPHGRPPSTSSSGTTSDRGFISPPYYMPRRIANESTASHDGEQSQAQSDKGWGRVDLPDSPYTVASPPVPHTPVIAAVHDEDAVRITDTDRQRGSVVLSDSNVTPLEPPLQARKLARKKTPPSLHPSDDTSDSSNSQTPSKSPRLRTKRHQQRPANLRIRPNSRSNTLTDQKTPSPHSLAPEWPADADIAVTPRATNFDTEGPRSVSPRSAGRVRKTSTDSPAARTRKVSTGSKEAKRMRDSAAEEGDDEGYDDLLSAYESEEGSKFSPPR